MAASKWSHTSICIGAGFALNGIQLWIAPLYSFVLARFFGVPAMLPGPVGMWSIYP